MTEPHHSPSVASLARLSLGTAPDSWGVWFPQDDHQVGWKQYLDEVALAGYLYTELGPQGFGLFNKRQSSHLVAFGVLGEGSKTTGGLEEYK